MDSQIKGSNAIRFVVLRDSTGTLQCVVKRDKVGDASFEEVASALIESSLRSKERPYQPTESMGMRSK